LGVLLPILTEYQLTLVIIVLVLSTSPVFTTLSDITKSIPKSDSVIIKGREPFPYSEQCKGWLALALYDSGHAGKQYLRHTEW
jgi:hypothetical protein